MRKVSPSRSAAARKGWETRSERDEAVVVNLDPSTVSLWKRVRYAFKGTPHERAEQFAEYVEEHPGEAIDAIQDYADAEVARMIARREREDRELARAAASPDADDASPDADDASPDADDASPDADDASPDADDASPDADDADADDASPDADDTIPAFHLPAGRDADDTIPAFHVPAGHDADDTIPAFHLPAGRDTDDTIPAFHLPVRRDTIPIFTPNPKE
jgi:hypothetical protein